MDKRLLLLGASSDLGAALIRSASVDYSQIFAQYLHMNDTLRSLKEDLGEKLTLLQADLSVPAEASKLPEAILTEQKIPDHIVHLASPRLKPERFHKLNPDVFSEHMRVDLFSLVPILRAFLPQMKKQKYGRVVMILSAYTQDIKPKFAAPYACGKYALLGLIQSLASEYDGTGVTINGISPDMIQTKFLSEMPRLMVEQYADNRPGKKLLSPEDVVPVVRFLLSDEASGLNGTNISVR